MEKTYDQKDMNLSPHPLEHLTFGCVMLINYICIKLFSISAISELIELVFIIPLKILPFATAYIAYKKQWHEAGRGIWGLFKKKKTDE